jgi:hypothetical protein
VQEIADVAAGAELRIQGLRGFVEYAADCTAEALRVVRAGQGISVEET